MGGFPQRENLQRTGPWVLARNLSSDAQDLQ